MSAPASFPPAAPQSAELGDDMRAAALDGLIRRGHCSLEALAGYGFSSEQIRLQGEAAIRQARELWQGRAAA